MRFKNLLIAASFCVLAAGCQKSIGEGVSPSSPASGVPEQATVPGVMKIHVTEELAAALLESADDDGVITETKSAGFDLAGLGISSVRTTFMIGGPFEASQREAGLHRWFTVEYDEDAPLTRASSAISGIEGVEATEPVLRLKTAAVSMDDPMYNDQWHYYNNGQFGFTKGIDIRLQEAWDAYGVFGNSSVIVAVVDGGVDITHPDLVGNLWVNEKEKNGQSGKDDDGNGYKDDAHGYNFVTNSADIHGEEHGTHVAGTVAAVNNNGIGVCGVAGGKYPEQGVRLMCLQIMDERHKGKGASIERVFQYAAENGATIIQNSWGYEIPPTSMMPSDKAAVDYFVKNAGTDGKGNQTGPMKGGLVVFAAGNEAVSLAYPGAYDKVLAVAAIGPYGKAAYYTNYGSWVDVCAPGGDVRANAANGGVLSTFPGGKYGKIQGTSMACPHVSGLAALVLSVSGGDGYTCDMLYETMVNSTDPDIYDYNQAMKGQLGSGMIDAVLALSSISTIAPEPVTELSAEAKSNTIYLTADVPADEDNDVAYYYNVYYSKNPFTADKPESAEKRRFVIKEQEDAGDGNRRIALNGLDFNTLYYYAVSASDFANNESALTAVASVETGGNTAPAISADSEEPIIVGSFQTVTRVYTSSDADGHKTVISCDVKGNPGLSVTKIADDKIEVSVIGVKAAAGEGSFVLTAKDEYGMTFTEEVKFTVLENHAPVLLKEIGTLCINGVGGTASVDINEYFSDEDNEPLSVVTNISDRNVVSFKYTDGIITFNGKQVGTATVRLSAADAKGESANTKFTVYVRDSSKPFDIYPNPVTDVLNIRTGSAADCKVRIYSVTGSTVYSGEADIDIAKPFSIDMKNAAPGSYTVVLTLSDGSELRSSFVKL